MKEDLQALAWEVALEVWNTVQSDYDIDKKIMKSIRLDRGMVASCCLGLLTAGISRGTVVRIAADLIDEGYWLAQVIENEQKGK